MSFTSMIEELKGTTGRIEKEEILSFHETEFTKNLLREALDPNLLHNVKLTKKSLPKESGTDFLEDKEKEIEDLFFNLRFSQSSKENKAQVVDVMKSLTRDDQEVLLAIVNKKLKVGISIKTVNKVFPGLIDAKPIALANKYNPKKNYGQEYWDWSYKLDGMRVFCFRIDGKWRIHSRAKDFLGNELTTLDHWKPELERFFQFNGFSYVEGEAYKHGMPFSTIQSAVMSPKNKKTEIAEQLLLHAFLVGDCHNQTDPAIVTNVRRSYNRLFINCEHLVAVFYGVVGNTKQEILWYLEQAVAKGYEGIMLKHQSPKYALVPKRSDYLLKVKTDTFDTTKEIADCKIVHVHYDDYTVQENGVFTTEVLPVRIDVLQANGKVCGVGSGFTLDWRRLVAEDSLEIVGKTAEIQFQGYGSKGLMRFPQFLRVREDV